MDVAGEEKEDFFAVFEEDSGTVVTVVLETFSGYLNSFI